MIAALVTFDLDMDNALALDEAAARFNSTAPGYRGLAGLRAKAYLYGDEGAQLGGFYIWESRAAADTLYTDEWRAKVTEVYGVPPVVHYFDVPVFIDNRETAAT